MSEIAKLQGARYFAINRSVISSTTRHENKMQRAPYGAQLFMFFLSLGKWKKFARFSFCSTRQKIWGSHVMCRFMASSSTEDYVVSGILRFFNEEEGFMN